MHFSKSLYQSLEHVTIKQVANNPATIYIFDPLAAWTVSNTNIHMVLSANMASILGTIPALVSGVMVTADTLRIRQIGALAFFGHFYFDSLDGVLAKNEMKPGTVDSNQGKQDFI